MVWKWARAMEKLAWSLEWDEGDQNKAKRNNPQQKHTPKDEDDGKKGKREKKRLNGWMDVAQDLWAIELRRTDKDITTISDGGEIYK